VIVASVAIGELVTPVETWSPERDAPDETFTYIDLSAVDQDEKIIVGVRDISCVEAPSRARQILNAGDVLVSTVRPNLNAVACVPPDLHGATASTGFCVLRPHPGKLDSRYLFHWARTSRFIGEMVRRATGASYPAVSDRIVCESKLPAPPLPEQRRIAEILDKGDRLRAKRLAALAQLDTLSQSIFLEMFGDPVTSKREWSTETIEAIAASGKHAIVDGPFGSSIKPDDYRPSGVPVIRITNITKDGYFSEENLLFIDKSLFASLKRSSIAGNDVLVSRVGTLGNTCIFPSDFGDALLSTTGVCKISLNLNRMIPVFLHTAMRLPSFQAQIERSASTSVQKYFNLSALRNWKIIVPPISLQHEFAGRFEAVETLKSAQRASLIRLDDLFASLQHRAFRGEL
jgi:type I restriction enzyme, S subunit